MRVRGKCLAATRTAKKGGNWSKCGLGTGKHINTLMEDRLPEGILRKDEKYHCPKDCDSLTDVCVNQAVRDNLSPSAHVRSDVKMEKVLLCLKAHVP